MLIPPPPLPAEALENAPVCVLEAELRLLLKEEADDRELWLSADERLLEESRLLRELEDELSEELEEEEKEELSELDDKLLEESELELTEELSELSELLKELRELEDTLLEERAPVEERDELLKELEDSAPVEDIDDSEELRDDELPDNADELRLLEPLPTAGTKTLPENASTCVGGEEDPSSVLIHSPS